MAELGTAFPSASLTQPGPFEMNERSKMGVTLPTDVWARIVFAAQESEDWRLRTLIEQAVYEAHAAVIETPSKGSS